MKGEIRVGDVYGRLTVKQTVARRALCVCSCGKNKETHACSLLSGNTRSCGCLFTESSSRNGKNNLLTETQRADRESLPFVCVRCGIGKSPDQFYYYTSAASRKRNKRTVCKSCGNKSTYAYRRRNPEKAKRAVRYSGIKKLYSLSIGEHCALIEKQGGLCAICRQPPSNGRELCVDHCHDTNIVRGLLCGKCNPTLGLMNDDPSLLRAAADYLEKFVNRSNLS